MRAGGMFWIGLHTGLAIICASDLNAIGLAINVTALCLHTAFRRFWAA